MPLSESDILDRHRQSLGEAHRACQRLGRQADPDLAAPRGRDYGELREALDRLEGSARQMAHFRSDARWVKLGVLYARIRRAIQVKFVGQRWEWFSGIMPIFEQGIRHFEELKANRTGVRGAILPVNPSAWLVMPEQKLAATPAFMPTSQTRH